VAKTIAVLIGSFPEPVHGASTINRKLSQLLKQRGIPVEHIDLSPGTARGARYHLARAARAIIGAFRVLSTPSVGRRRFLMSIDGGAGLIYNIILAAAVRLTGWPLMLYHHSTRYILSESRLVRLLLHVAGQATHVMCSEKMLFQFRARYGGEFPALVVSNVAWVDLPDVPGLGSDSGLRLGHLSGLTDAKGLGRAIETLRELRGRGADANLILAGTPQDLAAQRAIADAQAEFGPRFSHVGVLSGDAKCHFYAGLDVFLFPSLYPHETQSLVVPEALAAGTPVIAYDHRFVDEVLGSGGLLIPSDHHFATDAVDWILSGNSMWLKDQRRAARHQIETVHSTANRQIEVLISWVGDPRKSLK
jgi:glycosyltransferase involved in cell wall biosynthesis